MSKLLSRLSQLGLVENRGAGQSLGGSNSWHLTPRGVRVVAAGRPRLMAGAS